MHAGALETESAMAFLTLTSELAQVYVILRMTGDAFPIELDLRCGLLVASRAAQFCVRTGEREARLFAVVELPHAPAIRGVAVLALISEAAFVNIRFLVATQASRGLDPEGSARMALFARNRDVQAEKRKFRQVVIEVDHRLPALGQMTIVAGGAQPGSVNVTCPVTAHAVCR